MVNVFQIVPKKLRYYLKQLWEYFKEVIKWLAKSKIYNYTKHWALIFFQSTLVSVPTKQYSSCYK
jgi:hypothetical protein